MYRVKHIDYRDSVSDLWADESDPTLRSLSFDFLEMVNSGNYNVIIDLQISESGLTRTNILNFETEADWHIWRATSMYQNSLTHTANNDKITLEAEVGPV